MHTQLIPVPPDGPGPPHAHTAGGHPLIQGADQRAVLHGVCAAGVDLPATSLLWQVGDQDELAGYGKV